MSNILSRRLLLRGLPMAPAMAKQAVGEIVKQAVATTSAVLGDGRRGSSLAGNGLPPGADGWRSTYEYVMNQIRNGKMPEHKRIEYMQLARRRARSMEDNDVEALGSVSAGHRHRMHIESAYEKIVKEELEADRGNTMFGDLLKKFGGQP